MWLLSETERVELTLLASRAPEKEFHWLVGFKGATSRQGGCPAGQMIADYVDAGPWKAEGLKQTWRVRVAPGAADPFYAAVTVWCYWIFVDDPDNYFMTYCQASSNCVGKETPGTP